MIKFDRDIIDRIAEFFPNAIRRAFDDYDEFINGKQDEAAVGDVVSRNKAQKAIAAHVQLLLKLWLMLIDAGAKIPDDTLTNRNAHIFDLATKKYLEYQAKKAGGENGE